MDRRSWPWKKKSSDKAATEKVIATLESAGAPSILAGSHDSSKNPKYVQISVDTYAHLTGLEDQVKSYEDKVKKYEDKVKKYEDQLTIYKDRVKEYDEQMTSYDDKVKELEDVVEELNEKLSTANLEMVTKESLVKKHAKVAEEAVSGWEKAEAEALTLKNNLESVALLKLTAEDRASQLDCAVKECMRQIRNLKEEHEETLHEVAMKTKQFDMIRLELETQLGNLEQELLKSASDNATISRSLQERSNMLIKITEDKSQADAEIKLLKNNIDSCSREISSLKYELHVVAKELEIRNEEKNMSVRSAEVANKQNLEGLKKIAKLEADCQRLRGLVQKKLPGPAAVAQMKLEVERMDSDYGESRLRRSPAKPSTSPSMNPFTDFTHDNVQNYRKENELLTERLLAMEEETKMLKEALAKRNSELQASRSVCAKTVTKLRSLEAQLQANNQRRNTSNLNGQIPAEGSFSLNASNPPSMTSMSDDGNENQALCAGSRAISEVCNLHKGKNIDSPRKGENSDQLELMDDFLEMEKLAHSSKKSNETMASFDLDARNFEIVNHDLSEATSTRGLQLQDQQGSESLGIERSNIRDLSPCMKLQSRISMIFECASKDTDLEKLLEDIRNEVQNMQASLRQNSASSFIEEPYYTNTVTDHQVFYPISEELAAALSQIYEFVLLLGKEGKAIQGTSQEGNELTKILEEFSAAFNQVINNRGSLNNYILCLSQVFSKANYIHFDALGYKCIETEPSTSDCIDKVALPENKAVTNYTDSCAHFSDSTSDPDIPHDVPFVPTSELKTASWNCSLEDFRLLKSEKDNLVTDLARSTKNLEITMSRLQETEELLAEVKSQLTAAQNMNGLAETQLKCMAESYRSLEKHADELQIKVDCLEAKVESLNSELREERKNLADSFARCIVLQEDLKRVENFPVGRVDTRSSQETELVAAAEKLAECQETIFLLGKHLDSMRPQMEFVGSPTLEGTRRKDEIFPEDKLTSSSMLLQNVDTSVRANFATKRRVGSDSDIFSTPIYPSDSDASNLSRSPVSTKHQPKHRPTKSGSSSSTLEPEKHRGVSRFFSTKTKSEN
ncbi:filament-like plant protein 4 isoform X2 [Daucus carota subsp. sativus]|uniref:filament-like plant protein 4 isoform X2 n=1 Tax=Daucus carota subsp. sativus TaxID=79200 RepID=UPI003082BE73